MGKTWSCYKGEDLQCGICGTCMGKVHYGICAHNVSAAQTTSIGAQMTLTQSKQAKQYSVGAG
jgi:hypothetical protein